MGVASRTYFHTPQDCLRYVEDAKEVLDTVELTEAERVALFPQVFNLLSAGQVVLDDSQQILAARMSPSLRTR